MYRKDPSCTVPLGSLYLVLSSIPWESILFNVDKIYQLKLVRNSLYTARHLSISSGHSCSYEIITLIECSTARWKTRSVSSSVRRESISSPALCLTTTYPVHLRRRQTSLLGLSPYGLFVAPFTFEKFKIEIKMLHKKAWPLLLS